MQIVKNILLNDRHGRPIATDVYYDGSSGKRPVVVYAHGFNGFKDWGRFELVAEPFVRAGFTIVSFNFSFNGTTPEAPEEFVDLEAFRENNYTKELDNLQAVIEWVCDAGNPYAGYMDADRLGLIGHSMGGGIVLIKAAEEPRVKAVVTWASVAECKTPWGNWPEERIAAWREQGVEYVENGRTKQQMPLGYQLYADYQHNRERLDIGRAIGSLRIPVLIVHGTADPAVPVEAARRLQSWQPGAKLFTLDTDHVFGRKHPWDGEGLPEAMRVVVEQTAAFFREAL